ncbi:hypothetical protein FOXG_18851 [Fusarium oxysporum f. sp. lycopersici 4287]|uniref:Uncharacterized protein n=2 Tax=Fusarium oxysporum TaxID=5507 RepID=A0A0J9UPS9_FUSO4|nr:hypothetical protein FOXG_18851 [Fusarium oxysporum f. sp. lycopersici 4287]EXK43613.1 hypothetical protein FOMG_02551 [Fusarium oxysporum f. sp. melonis 26406]KNB01285.1 hypothetical protein FOXG_18851 [Fusarium oxysporum f. sp. lycopersici 4287]
MSDTTLVNRGGDHVLQATSPQNGWRVDANYSGENREDLEVAIWSHRKNASDYLRAYFDANAQSSYGSSMSSCGDALENGKSDLQGMAVVASHDQLQLHLVPLCSLLSRVHREARRLAIQSQVYLSSATFIKFIYSTFMARQFYSKGINDFLSGCVGASALYGAYRTLMWSLVYLRWRGATSLKRRLDEGQVTEDSRYELEGLSWSWVESYIKTLH